MPDDFPPRAPLHPLLRLALGVTADAHRRHVAQTREHRALAPTLRTTPEALRLLDAEATSRLPVDELMARLGATPRGGV